MSAGSNTVVSIVVNEPGEATPISANIVEDVLYQSLQEDSATTVSDLDLAA
ncbi:Hypothetical predicted protein, partial [Paramuricea clavata]